MNLENASILNEILITPIFQSTSQSLKGIKNTNLNCLLSFTNVTVYAKLIIPMHMAYAVNRTSG